MRLFSFLFCRSPRNSRAASPTLRALLRCYSCWVVKMAPVQVLSTAFDISPPRRWFLPFSPSRMTASTQALTRSGVAAPVPQDSDFKLPKISSLVIVQLTSALLQVGPLVYRDVSSCNPILRPKISFFIIVSSANLYAEHLGGSATFSGLVIGIPTVFSGLSLLPLIRIDQGRMSEPFLRSSS